MPLHELLAALEDNETDFADIYITPSQDGGKTDQDSDLSDYEYEGNINNLSTAMLKVEAEIILYHSTHLEMLTSLVQDLSDDDLSMSSII